MKKYLKRTIKLGSLLILMTWSGLHRSEAAQVEKSGEAYNHYLKAMIEEGQGNLEAAQEELKKALELSPGNVQLQKEAAEMAFRQNQFQEASVHIEKAIALEPKDVKLHILAGQIYWALGNQEKAEEKLKKAVELGPDEAEALVNLAMAVTPKDPKRAIKLYTDYLDRHPAEVEIQERVAQLYQGMGEIAKARSAWDKVLDLAPGSIRAHLASAQIAEVQHDTATAISHYEAVLDQDPSNLPLLLRIGELRYRADDMSKAYDAFSKAQSIAPNSASANFWLALIAENRSDWNEAIRLLKSVAEKAPEPGVLLRLSYYYSQTGQRKEAIQLLAKLSEDEPENTDFLRYLAAAYEQDKQFDKALTVVTKLLSIDPENPDHLFHKATLYDRLNQFSQSEAYLKQAIQLDPQFHLAMNYLGYSYADKNIKLDAAEKLVNDAIALDPENGAYLDSMGWIYYRQGKYKKAEDFLQQASVIGKDALIWDHLGDAQAAQGNLLEAYTSWQTSLRMEGAQPNVLRKIDKVLVKFSPSQKILVFSDKIKADYFSLASLSGLVHLSACQKKSCRTLKGEFDYSKSGKLKAEVPGPMGVPVLMVSKSSGTKTQYGALQPEFLEIESYVVKAFDRMDSVLRAVVFNSLDRKELERTAVLKKNELRAQSKNVELAFDEKSGVLKQVVWGPPGATDTLTVKNILKDSSPPVPSIFEWSDDPTNFILKVNFVKPVVGSDLGPVSEE